MNAQNSKEIIYKMHDIKSCFKNAVKIYPKRKSDDITEKSNVLLFLKNNISNADTAGESDDTKISPKKLMIESRADIPKKKNICIKYKDLVVDSDKSDDSDSHLELALIIKKKRKYTNNPKIKIAKCDNICLHINKIKEEDINNQLNKRISKSCCKVILGSQNKENIFIKRIKRKLFCC